ncbi:hypothetical protein TWF694_003172 [Orbilia ellipsospora]|uniref:Uncharacterized protein n=1 Tax=Orbilia ellipsospora TaxID=2528407 RepID=A0AAV9X384_9PEZI
MQIKPYHSISPPLRPSNIGGLPPRRISAIIIEEDLSDVDSTDSSWFLPANTYEKITISQKEVPADSESVTDAPIKSSSSPIPKQNLDIPTAADTSRRPSICLARLQTQCIDDVDIKLPNYDYIHSPASGSLKNGRRDSTSEVFFHSPLRRTRTYSEYSSNISSSSSVSECESPVFYPDSDDACDCDCEDHNDSVVSKNARSQPIRVPRGSHKRQRRGCFVQNDLKSRVKDEDNVMEDDEEEDCEFEEIPLDDWVQFAYEPSTNFETALITEVVRRRKSDERFATLKSQGLGYEKELENGQFSESHRRSQWIKDMVRLYPQECGGGHVLPCMN